MKNEKWLDCVHPWDIPKENYSVSDQGRVRGPRGILTPWIDARDYLNVQLSERLANRKYKGHSIKVARLVMLAFEGPRPKGMSINHIDEVKRNNAYSNLEYITKLANAEHSAKRYYYKGEYLMLKEIYAKIENPVDFNLGRIRIQRQGWVPQTAFTVRAT